jgi:hypothetical protein
MNKNIHNFTTAGVIKDDSLIIKSREHFERLLVQRMRDGGYVPVLDMLPQFNLKYNSDINNFSFVLTMFAVYVGKKKSYQVEGFSGQDFIKR